MSNDEVLQTFWPVVSFRYIRGALSLSHSTGSEWKIPTICFLLVSFDYNLVYFIIDFAVLVFIFSLPVLFIITTKLVIVSTNFFCIIYGLIKPNCGFPVDWTLHSIVQVITNLAHLLIVVHSADLPVYQV